MKKLSTTVNCGSMVMFFLLGISLLRAEEVNNFKIPETVKGVRIAGYFDAFNAADTESMNIFLKENLNLDALKSFPVERRLERYRGFQAQAIFLTPEKLLSESDEKMRVLARDGSDQYLEFTFNFEKGKEGKITTILVNMVEPEDLVDLSGPSINKKELIARIQIYLENSTKNDLFSGVVLLAEGDKILFHEAFGLASREYNAANQLDTRFNLGSINKLFTRIAIGQLLEQGRLSLDDTIGKFLPNYPNQEAARKVTIRQLLDMTSGIGDFFGEKYMQTPKDKIRNLEDYLPFFAHDSLLFEPGKDRVYSNGGYIILGLIVAKTSGMDYFEYVREHIYKPAGMSQTGHLQADSIVDNVASGYTHDGDDDEVGGNNLVLKNNIYTRPGRGSSAGGGYSTVDDLNRFALAIYDGKLLGDIGKEWFAGPQAYAGGAPGINAELDLNPVSGWTLVVLANGDPPMANKIARKINLWVKRLK